ncbi:phage holin family protein [Akkermansiaceae bacterium]|nr:phage holin family protein [Akkermansiaceae bacterium]
MFPRRGGGRKAVAPRHPPTADAPQGEDVSLHMSAEMGESPAGREGDIAHSAPHGTDAPKDWKAAIATLVSARLEIMRIEAKAASSAFAANIALLVAGLFALLSAWVLAIAATIGAIAAATSWEWYHVAFASAAAHLLIGALLLIILKSAKKTGFPVTRAEFEKDREWLEGLKKQ